MGSTGFSLTPRSNEIPERPFTDQQFTEEIRTYLFEVKKLELEGYNILIKKDNFIEFFKTSEVNFENVAAKLHELKVVGKLFIGDDGNSYRSKFTTFAKPIHEEKISRRAGINSGLMRPNEIPFYDQSPENPGVIRSIFSQKINSKPILQESEDMFLRSEKNENRQLKEIKKFIIQEGPRP